MNWETFLGMVLVGFVASTLWRGITRLIRLKKKRDKKEEGEKK